MIRRGAAPDLKMLKVLNTELADLVQKAVMGEGSTQMDLRTLHRKLRTLTDKFEKKRQNKKDEKKQEMGRNGLNASSALSG